MALFKAPQKKQRRKEASFCPLPVPSRHAQLSTWSYYKGHLEGGHVVVKMSGDVTDLAAQGYFGKRIGKCIDVEGASCKVEGECEDDADVVLTRRSRVEEATDDHLSLSFEESFFLSYGLACLFVELGDQRLDIKRQWGEFCRRRPQFPATYAAYHHFREKGWVPREGGRYGGDMVLYKKGPPFYHASYIVVVQCVDADTLKPTSTSRGLGWAAMAGLLRLATTVSKEVLLCYVIVPRDAMLTSPDCLRRFRVHESLLSRWCSSRQLEREMSDIDCRF